jgi:hypothetical protein
VTTPPMTTATADEAAVALLARLARLRDRVAALVERRSAGDPTAADPLRGLVLSDADVLHHLRLTAEPRHADVRDGEFAHQAGTADQDANDPRGLGDQGDPAVPTEPEPPAEAVVDIAPRDRLDRLTRRLRLTDLDAAILLIALAPDLDRGFEPLYGYLNDDVSRRRATIGLALDLCGLPATDVAGRDRFHPTAPLSALGLVRVEERERPFLSRSLRVPDRLVAHLLGDDATNGALKGYVRPLPALAAGAYEGDDERLIGQLAVLFADVDAPPVYLREQLEGDGLTCAAAALRAAGRSAMCFVPPAQPAAGGQYAEDGRDDDADHRSVGYGPVRDLLLEARLLGCAIVVSPLPERPGPLIRRLLVDADDVLVIFAGSAPYDPLWCDSDPLVVDAPRLRSGALSVWSAALGIDTSDDGALDLAAIVGSHRLGGERIRRAAQAALELAAFDGTALTAAHLRLAIRQQSTSRLEQHARRIRPAVGWDDLVLPAEPLARLHELALRARHRDRVLGDWRLSAGGGRGRGVLALFAGESGTGKTLSAEVVAADLGLDLYVVQLSSVVDKYVGETEKNLERIFVEADRTDAVLLFDEADAVFGKRSDVKDSHDRYANMESAYLLQRLDAFDGIAVLTTNLRSNIDDAFTRRLDLVIDFPSPDVEQRLALWRHSLGHVPCADDIDPGPCARDYELSGGSIHSAVVTAAYAAAGRGGAVTTADLLAGAQREYRKAGRLVMDNTSR